MLLVEHHAAFRRERQVLLGNCREVIPSPQLLSLRDRDFLGMGLSRPPPNLSLSMGVKVAKTQPCPRPRGVSIEQVVRTCRVERYLGTFSVFYIKLEVRFHYPFLINGEIGT